jgi:uncharacterized membrane protein
MSIRSLGLTLFASLALVATAPAQTFLEVPGGGFAQGISADGKIVVGGGSGGAFYWNWKADPTPTFIGGTDATAISDDGSVIVGCIKDPVLGVEVAARWTQATGWLSLGFLPNALNCPSKSNAYDVSADGSTVIGLSWDGCSGRAFYWTQPTGMLEMQVLGNGANRATAIAADGSAVAGFAQGTSNRTPAYWQPDLSGVLLDIDVNGEVHNLNSDASLSVGSMYQGGVSQEAFLRTSGGTVTNLGTLNVETDPLEPQYGSHAYDLSDDGQLVVGFDTLGTFREAWVWTSATGIVSLTSVLSSLGATGVPSFLNTCGATSDSGNVVIGSYVAAAPPFFRSFVAEFNSTPWVDLGGGTFGTLGQPLFEASGDLTAGSTLTLDVDNTPPSAIFLMWISLSSSPANVVGGTLYPLPADAKLVLAADPLGGFSVSSPVAAGVPPGVDIWFQCIVQDASNIHGITLTNCVRGTTP